MGYIKYLWHSQKSSSFSQSADVRGWETLQRFTVLHSTQILWLDFGKYL